MTNSEKIDLLITDMKEMKIDMQEMKTDMQEMKTDMEGMKTDMRSMNDRMDNLEQQVKQTERNLRNEIRKECALVLDEVERVHSILDKHKSDTSKHTA